MESGGWQERGWREKGHPLACSKMERRQRSKRSQGRGQAGMRLKSAQQAELIERKESKALDMGRWYRVFPRDSGGFKE